MTGNLKILAKALGGLLCKKMDIIIVKKNKKNHIIKEALDNFSLIPIFFSKKVEIFKSLEGYVYVINACAFLLATSIQLQRYKDFSFVGHFKKSTSKNTNTVVYGTLLGWC